MPIRTGIVLDQFRGNGLYPTLEAPSFLVGGVDTHGGHVLAGTGLRIDAPSGQVYYTLDGSDPRLIGGGLNPAALLFDPATSPDLVLDETSRLAARASTDHPGRPSMPPISR